MKKAISFVCIIALLLSSPVMYASSLSVPAKSSIVVNGETGSVIYSDCADTRLPMASTTKIMTAVLLIENADLNKKIKITREMVAVEGSSMGLLPGDTVDFRTLLYGLMLPSGNDAANTVAIALSGSLKDFSLMMNKKAMSLGMDNTNFVTPSGLDAKNHFTTARDMAKLSVYAMKIPLFRKVVSKSKITVNFGNPPYRRSLFGHNKLLKTYKYACGIKTGYTSDAGRCLVSAAECDGKKVIAVTLNDGDTLSSHKELLSYGLSKLFPVYLELPDEYRKIPVLFGKNDFADVYLKPRKVFLTAEEREALDYTVKMNKSVFGGCKKGTEIGNITYTVSGVPICKEKIALKNTAEPIKTENTRIPRRIINNFISMI